MWRFRWFCTSTRCDPRSLTRRYHLVEYEIPFNAKCDCNYATPYSREWRKISSGCIIVLSDQSGLRIIGWNATIKLHCMLYEWYDSDDSPLKSIWVKAKLQPSSLSASLTTRWLNTGFSVSIYRIGRLSNRQRLCSSPASAGVSLDALSCKTRGDHPHRFDWFVNREMSKRSQISNLRSSQAMLWLNVNPRSFTWWPGWHVRARWSFDWGTFRVPSEVSAQTRSLNLLNLWLFDSFWSIQI